MKLKSLEFIIFALGIAASILLLLNSFNFEGELISGLKLAFGGKLDFGSSVSVNAGKFKFNILYVLILLLPAAASILQTFVTDPFGAVGSLVLFVAAIVLALAVKETKFVVNVINVETTLDIKLDTLAIISVVLSGIGALLTVYKLIENK